MTRYIIHTRQHLDRRWEPLFEGFTLRHIYTQGQQPVTEIRGQVLDQAALYGLLARLRNLGAELISVQPEEEEG